MSSTAWDGSTDSRAGNRRLKSGTVEFPTTSVNMSLSERCTEICRRTRPFLIGIVLYSCCAGRIGSASQTTEIRAQLLLVTLGIEIPGPSLHTFTRNAQLELRRNVRIRYNVCRSYLIPLPGTGWFVAQVAPGVSRETIRISARRIGFRS
jgi:hypothetical protein